MDTMYRRCIKCNEQKPLTTEYYPIRSNDNGKLELRRYCKKCKNHEAKTWNANTKKKNSNEMHYNCDHCGKQNTLTFTVANQQRRGQSQ